MKKTAIISAVSLLLWCSAPAFSQDNGAANPLAATSDEEAPNKLEILREPMFSLVTSEGDSPILAKKKAALRLFKGYSVTVGLLNSCQTKTPQEAKTALGTFNQRNGTTLGLAMATIKRLGGFNKEIKMALDTAITSEVMIGVPNCQALCQAVLGGNYDIYKSPNYINDYAIMRSETPLPLFLPLPLPQSQPLTQP